jgi:hypothetical protein
MSWTAVELRPGVNTQLTLSANQAGVSLSQMIRYKDGMIQTPGGWTTFPSSVTVSIASTVRDLHPWQDFAGVMHLGVAATNNVAVITTGSQTDITPQTFTDNPSPNFSISSGSNLVTVVDPGSSQTVNNTVYFNTPVAIGAFLLNGAYPINSVLGSSIYTLLLPSNSTSTIASSGKLPTFTTTANSATVTVTLSNHNFLAVTGLYQQFIAATSVGGQTIQGPYQIKSVIDTTSFTITLTQQATTAATATMNASLAQLVYYVTIGPAAAGTGYSAGGYSSGSYSGVGGATTPAQGTPITATDYTEDNWGEVLLACPENGPIYAWAPNFGFQNMQVINQAPFFNGGIFVAMPQQILVAWRSDQSSGVQDPLRVRWSNQEDYTNWTVSNQTTAGSFKIPTGSRIMGGIQAPMYGLISTDVDVWTMTYVGGTVIFSFLRVGSGCGWLSSHACGILNGAPYWISGNNFFTLAGKGVVPLPCSVWDQVFQNINLTYASKVRVAVNSLFNEVTWFYPSATATECNSYVKVHIEGNEFEWDYGLLDGTAWCDASILGGPIRADHSGQLWQHESGTAITGAGLPSFQSGWFAIAEGQQMAFVDFVMPDFIWGTRSGAQDASVQITFSSVNFPGDTPFTYGPYTVTQATEFINTRIRGRLMSVLVQSTNVSEFWRLGRIRYRFATMGRR